MKTYLYILLSFSSCLSYANDYEYMRNLKDDVNAIRILEERSKKGETKAQVRLGGIYISPGKHQNYNKAFYWYKKSAEAGDDVGQLALAIMYERGQVPNTSFEIARKEAIKWYKLSAKNGNPVAQFNLQAIKQ